MSSDSVPDTVPRLTMEASALSMRENVIRVLRPSRVNWVATTKRAPKALASSAKHDDVSQPTACRRASSSDSARRSSLVSGAIPENCDSRRETRAGTVMPSSRAAGTKRKSASRTTTGSFSTGASAAFGAAAALVDATAKLTTTAPHQRRGGDEAVAGAGGTEEGRP